MCAARMDATHSAWDRLSVCLMITGRKLLLSNCAEGGREVVYSEAVRPRGNSAGGRKNQNCVKIICVTKNADSGRGAVPAPFCLNPHFVVCTFFVALWRLRRRLLRIHFLPWNFFKFNFPPSLPPSFLGRQSEHCQSCCDGEKITAVAAAVLVHAVCCDVVLIAHFKVRRVSDSRSLALSRTHAHLHELYNLQHAAALPPSLPLLRSAWTAG